MPLGRPLDALGETPIPTESLCSLGGVVRDAGKAPEVTGGLLLVPGPKSHKRVTGVLTQEATWGGGRDFRPQQPSGRGLGGGRRACRP